EVVSGTQCLRQTLLGHPEPLRHPLGRILGDTLPSECRVRLIALIPEVRIGAVAFPFEGEAARAFTVLPFEPECLVGVQPLCAERGISGSTLPFEKMFHRIGVEEQSRAGCVVRVAGALRGTIRGVAVVTE